MSRTITLPDLDSAGPATGGRWMVVIYNNDHNNFDEVIQALMQGTGCGEQEAEIEAWEAHTFGKAPVHFAAESECQRAAATIGRIGVKTEVCREWED